MPWFRIGRQWQRWSEVGTCDQMPLQEGWGREGWSPEDFVRATTQDPTQLLTGRNALFSEHR